MPPLDDITDESSGVIITDPSDAGPGIKDTPLDEITRPKSSGGTDSGSALDQMFDKAVAQKTGSASEKDEDELPPETDEAEETTEKGESKSKKEDSSIDAEASKKQAEKDAKAKTDADAKTAAEEKTKPEAKEEPKDKLSEVKLPPHAKPNTVKSFDEVKRRAREEIAVKDREIADLKAKLPKDGGVTPEIQKELDELRSFRKAHDFQNDPEFKKTYVDPVNRNNESILAKLKEARISDANLEEIKKIGLDKLDWEPILTALPPIQRRAVEAMLLENDRLEDKRKLALEEAKNLPQDYAAKQQKAEEERRTAEVTTVKSTVDDFLAKSELLKEIPVPADATVEQKKEIEQKNAFIKEQSTRLEQMLSDNSPEMRGTLIASTLFAYSQKREAAHWKAQAEKATAELAKIRKASATRSGRQAPAPSEIPPAKQGIIRNGSDALDSIRDSIVKND